MGLKQPNSSSGFILSHTNLTRTGRVFLFILCLIASLPLSTVKAVTSGGPSAVLYAAPSGYSLVSGSNFSAELRLKVAGDSMHSARVRVTYSSDKMELISANPGPLFFVADRSNESGGVGLTYGSLSAVTGDVLYATLNFKITGSSGSANITIDPAIDPNNHSYVAGDSTGTGANILSGTANGNYTINAADSSSTPSSAATSTPQSTGQSSSPTGTADSKASTDKPTDTQAATKTPAIRVSSSGTPLQKSTALTQNTAKARHIALYLGAVLLGMALPIAFRVRKKRKHRSFIPVERKETVAQIESRIKNKDRSKDTVAEMEARLKGKDHSKETVAELEARIKLKNNQKQPKKFTKSATKTKKTAN